MVVETDDSVVVPPVVGAPPVVVEVASVSPLLAVPVLVVPVVDVVSAVVSPGVPPPQATRGSRSAVERERRTSILSME
jgi:hypothetical protein